MDDVKIISIIKPLLKNYDISEFETLKPQTQQQLIEIEKYFQQSLVNYKNIKESIDKLNLSIRGICKGSDLGKSTIYNKSETLLKYIDKRLNEIECNIVVIPKPEVDKLVTKVEQLETTLDKTIVDIVEFQNMRSKITKLENYVARLEEQKQILNEQINDYITTNNELQKELNIHRKKVIKISKE